MKDRDRARGNAYALHYAVLQWQVLEATSANRSDLEDAGIELTEGWLSDALEGRSDCLTYVTRFDALKRLHILGELSVDDKESVVARLSRADVFFALALAENDAAHYMFSPAAVASGWDPANTVRCGLDAAVSATSAYMFGLGLKSQVSLMN